MPQYDRFFTFLWTMLRVAHFAADCYTGVPPKNNLSHHFDKYLHDMDLKLTEHVRNTITLLYKHKTG